MANEAARVIEEGVVDSTDAVDLATLLGLGLAPFRGGAARYVDDEGAEEIVRELEMLAERHGERFEPAPLLQRAADEGRPLASYGRGSA
jgi:3-hydroxyacyl-CoA dehydrogenase/enoyl-CoA hydratase/3-hydroxybutyryl-CoA epimerase